MIKLARPSLEIAVVGCGVAGMAAAVLLARSGHRVRLFERFREPQPVGSGLLLQPLGLQVLDQLGILQRILASGARIDRLHGAAHPSGRCILDIAYRELGPGLHGLGIHRASLFAALHDAVLAAPVDLLPDTGIAGIEEAADARPFLVDVAGRRSGPFDLAVDASGAQSILRLSLGGKPPCPFRYGALWTTLPLDGHGFDRSTLIQRYAGASRMIGVMPVGAAPGTAGEHAAFFWSIRMDRLAAWRDGGLTRWQDDVASVWPEAGAFIAHIADPAAIVPAFYVHFTARRPVARRFALIGDAAHATSPQLGQGANMALLDAAALADAIDHSASLEDALDAYAAKRRRHVRFYQRASFWLTPLFQSDVRLGGMARDLLFPLLASIPWLRREAAVGLAGLKAGLFRRIEAAPAARPHDGA